MEINEKMLEMLGTNTETAGKILEKFRAFHNGLAEEFQITPGNIAAFLAGHQSSLITCFKSLVQSTSRQRLTEEEEHFYEEKIKKSLTDLLLFAASKKAGKTQ